MKEFCFQGKTFYCNHFPAFINVEVFHGQCPCSCKHCPVGLTPTELREERFGLKSISLKLFEKILDEVSRNPSCTIRLHSVGEPLFWNKLPEALDLIRKKGVTTWIFTNAVTSDKNLLADVARSIDVVEVSVNSSEAQDYLDSKGVDAWKNVTENIEFLSKMMKQNGKGRLLVSRVESADVEGNEAFIKHWMATGLVNDAFVRTKHSFNRLVAKNADSHPHESYVPCIGHSTRLSIAYDGKVVVCFNELFRKTLEPGVVLGDINEQSITDVWNGELHWEILSADATGDFSTLPFSIPCSTCDCRQPSAEVSGRQTSEYQIQELRK